MTSFEVALPRTIMRRALPRRDALFPVPSRDLRSGLDALAPETRRVVRGVGSALAVGTLVLAFAAAAQTAAYGPHTESGGALAWLFALFVCAAILGVFLLVLSLVRAPERHPGDRLPGTTRDR